MLEVCAESVRNQVLSWVFFLSYFSLLKNVSIVISKYIALVWVSPCDFPSISVQLHQLCITGCDHLGHMWAVWPDGGSIQQEAERAANCKRFIEYVIINGSTTTSCCWPCVLQDLTDIQTVKNESCRVFQFNTDLYAYKGVCLSVYQFKSRLIKQMVRDYGQV